MLSRNRFVAAVLCLSAFLVMSCGRPDSGAPVAQSDSKNADTKVLNLYVLNDFLAPDTLPSFEKLTGVKVRVTVYGTNEELEAQMLTGHSGFDVVFPSGPYFQRQIRSGVYLPLDKSKLPNLANLDPGIMSRVSQFDPGNAHGVVYVWGSFGIGYNKKTVEALLPKVSIDSWRLIFDPAIAAKLAGCGINIVDTPAGVTRLVLKYLGKDPNSLSPQDLDDAESVLVRIRPYIRNIDTSGEIEAMANGDICIALGYNGDFVLARQRAKEAKNGIQIDYVVPREGSLVWFDLLAIPRDAPHAANAHLFINYLMDPQVIAKISNFIGYANANVAAMPLLDASLASDPVIYPTLEEKQRLFVQTEDTPEKARAITRLWQKFKTGQ
jgi:putrescine transport system substrate-binding protein